MAFVTDTNGRRYPLSRLLSFKEGVRGRISAEFEGTDVVPIFEPEAWEVGMAEWAQQTIPAQPGTYLLKDILDDGPETPEAERDDASFYKEQVLAWVLTYAGALLPVGLNGVERDDLAILLPDGSVERPFRDAFSSEEDYKRSRRAEAARTHAARAQVRQDGT